MCHLTLWLTPSLGGHILVIGSQTPWIEAMLLELGAANITTLEYSPAVSLHPQVRIVSPEKLNEMVSTADLEKEKETQINI